MAQTVPFLPVWEHHSHLPASINTKRSNIHRLLSLSLLLIVSAGYWLFSCFLCCSLIKLLLMLPQHCRSKYIESNKRRNSVCTSSLYLQSGENKLAKLRRHASRIHFALTHFGKIHFKEIHFGMGCGPVDWWGGSSQNQNSKINGLSFFIFFYLSDRYWDVCKNSYWGPVEWVGDQLNGLGASWLVLPESKFEKKMD